MSDDSKLIKELGWLRDVARGLVNDDAAAGDLAQEVALAALLAPPPVERSRLRAWLWTVARRKAVRARANAGARRQRELDAHEEGRDRGRSSGRLTLYRELLDHVNALDEVDRSLIVQRYLDGMTPLAMARDAGVSSEVMRKRISRALDRLRVRLRSSERGLSFWSSGLCWILEPGRSAGLGGVLEPSTGHDRRPRPIEVQQTFSSAVRSLGQGSAKLMIATVLGIGLLGFVYWWGGSSPPPSDQIVTSALAADAERTVSLPRGRSQAKRRVASENTAGDFADRPSARAESRRGSAAVAIRFVNGSGEPVSDVRAVWDGAGGTPQVVSVDRDGRSSIPFGRDGVVYAAAGGYQDEAFAIDQPGGEVAFVLDEVFIVRGIVRVVDGAVPRALRIHSAHQRSNRWPHQASDDPRLQQTLLATGIPFVPVHADVSRDGSLTLELTKHRYSYELVPPADLQVVSVKGANSWNEGFSFVTPPEWIEIQLRQLPHAVGRLVWEDDESPVTGSLDWSREDSKGWSPEQPVRVELAPDGTFEVPVSDEAVPGARGPAWSFVIRSQGSVVRGDLPVDMDFATTASPSQLGTIELPRPVRHTIRVVDAATGEPVNGAVVSAGEEGWMECDADGRSTLVDPKGAEIFVGAPGYEFRRAPILQPLPSVPATFEVRIQRAQRLRVVVPISSYDHFEHDRSLAVRMDFEQSPFGGSVDQVRDGYGFRDLSRALQGSRLRAWRLPGDRSAKGRVEFGVVANEDLLIDGLLPDVPFTLELNDGFGQTLQSRDVTMDPLASDEGDESEFEIPVQERVVRFDDPVSQTGTLIVHCRMPGSDERWVGRVQVVSESGRVSRYDTDDEGIVRIPFLKPGAYRILARDDQGTIRPGEGTRVEVDAGEQEFEMQVVR